MPYQARIVIIILHVFKPTILNISYVYFAEKSTLKNLISHLESRITQLTGEQEDNVTLNKLEVVAVNQKLQESIQENEHLRESLLTMREEVRLVRTLN